MGKPLHEGLKRLADWVDPQHVLAAERLQQAVWALEPVERIPNCQVLPISVVGNSNTASQAYKEMK